MWTDIDITDLSIINDIGVGLGHDSQPFFEGVRRFQFCDDPIATYSAPFGSSLAASADDGDEVLGLSDPVARELYVHDAIRERAAAPSAISTPKEVLASSILHVHEPVHAGLADQFTHYYGHIRLLSFARTLSHLGWAQ